MKEARAKKLGETPGGGGNKKKKEKRYRQRAGEMKGNIRELNGTVGLGMTT